MTPLPQSIRNAISFPQYDPAAHELREAERQRTLLARTLGVDPDSGAPLFRPLPPASPAVRRLADLNADLLAALRDLVYEIQGQASLIGSECEHAVWRAQAAIAELERAGGGR